MANQEHLDILKQGVATWNKWRQEHEEIQPNLSGAYLSKAKLIRANLRLADLSKANLSGADLSGAGLSEADLSGAGLSGADLYKADLSGADLSSTNLSDANLIKANLRLADLIGANLIGADLSGADLSGAGLSEANLIGANLNGANLSGADLSGANLSWADLSSTNLSGADLSGADLSRAGIGWTSFGNVNLSEGKGLETVKHSGPSTIGIDTIYLSQGSIPDVFLRGCGVPDSFITYMPSLMGKAIQFYSCFISYSSKDEEFAKRLYADLQAKGLRIWFAPEDIKSGRKTHEQISEAIRLYEKLLVVLSQHSMESEWVKTEVFHARQDEERNNKRKLFPISLVPFEDVRQWSAFDADVGKDMAREVREYSIPDFSNWKDHDAYQKAFDRLLRDLQASESEPYARP